MKISVELEEKEWEELIHVASNGYGDGTLYDLDRPNRFRPDGWRTRRDRYLRAVEAIQTARKEAKR